MNAFRIDKSNDRKSFFYLFLFLFPILPQNYYVIGSINTINCLSILLLVWFICRGKMKVINIQKNNIWFWLYMLVYAVQNFATNDFVKGVSYLLSYAFVSYVIASNITTPKEFLKVIDLLIWSGLILGFLGIVESLSQVYIFQGQSIDASSGIRYGLLRATTTFGHPICYGMYQSIIAILAFYRIYSNNIPKRKKKWYILVYVVTVVSVFVSVSRLAICLLVFAQMLILFQLGLNKFLKYVCGLVLLLVILLFLTELIGFDFLILGSDFFVSLKSMLGLSTEAKGFGNDVIGFGNRFDLYSWVSQAVKGNELFGLGIQAEFAYKMYDWFTKTSIEVHYLYVYYKQGLVGLIFLVFSYIGTLRYIHKKGIKKKCVFEKKLSFNGVMFSMLVAYYICLFGVQETDLTRVYNLLICLVICYNNIRKKWMEVC